MLLLVVSTLDMFSSHPRGSNLQVDEFVRVTHMALMCTVSLIPLHVVRETHSVRLRAMLLRRAWEMEVEANDGVICVSEDENGRAVPWPV